MANEIYFILFYEVTEDTQFLYRLDAGNTYSIEEIKEYFNLPFKIINWDGNFLSKIDLSEVSFDNVLWRDSFLATKPYQNLSIKCFRNTNGKIDLSKAVKSKQRNNMIIIDSIDFSGTKISNFQFINIAYDCDFSNCGLESKEINIEKQHFSNCDFSENDFSNTVIDNFERLSYFAAYGDDEFRCYFSNTGLKLNINIEALDAGEKEMLTESIKDEKFGGCYLNGKRLQTREEQKDIKEQVKSEYNELLSDIYQKIDLSIEESKSGRKK